MAPGVSTAIAGVSSWQPTLFGAVTSPSFDPTFPSSARRFLGAGAWVDHAPGALDGPDSLFDEVLAAAPWAAHDRPMYDRVVAEPRLTTRRWDHPPALVLDLADALSARYGLDLGVVSANLYRDGNDSVAWHGDRVGRSRSETVVAILSLGAPRRFLMRPKGGGSSTRYLPAAGDLLVMGGTCQRTWEHCVPKSSHVVGPRISVMFREAY